MRDEIIERVAEVILEDHQPEEDTTFDVAIKRIHKLGEFLSKEQISTIKTEMDMKLLDDDYGSGKDFELVYSMVDEYIVPTVIDDRMLIISKLAQEIIENTKQLHRSKEREVCINCRKLYSPDCPIWALAKVDKTSFYCTAFLDKRNA